MGRRRCECGRAWSSFGLPGEGRKGARWCSRCPERPEGAVNVVDKRCECGRAGPSFGLPGEGRQDARWCSRCPDRPEGAVNVVSKRCECGRAVPSFGLPGEPSRWCVRCPSKPSSAVHSRTKSATAASRAPRRPRQAPSIAQAPAVPSTAGARAVPGATEEEASFVGRRVQRPFYDPDAPPSAPPRLYPGKVNAVRTGVPGHGTVWRVVYEDGDEEELSRGELEEALLEPVYIKEEDGPLRAEEVHPHVKSPSAAY